MYGGDGPDDIIEVIYRDARGYKRIIKGKRSDVAGIVLVNTPKTINFNPDTDSYDIRPTTFNVKVSRNDQPLGQVIVNGNTTIKSILDSIKGGSNSRRCIISSYNKFLNSIGPQDYSVPLNNLRLKHGQVELSLI